jgi:enterochelin esterase-like enzyme
VESTQHNLRGKEAMGLAKVSHTRKDRQSGWPPEGTDRSRFRPLSQDDIALTVLWVLVVAGLLALGSAFFPTLLQWAGRHAGIEIAYAAVQDSEAGFSSLNHRSASPVQETNVSSEVGVASGTVLDSTMHSDTLGLDLPYRVYLPPGYSSSQDRYPVLYLLHGIGGNYTEWTEGNLVGPTLDGLISEGQVRPMIVFMPEGNGSYYLNWAGGGLRWSDYVANDVVSFVDSHYRTIADRAQRAIGGHSMGGEAALQLAFNHPDLFSVVGGHSPSVRLSIVDVPAYFGDWDHYAGYDPVRLALSRDNLGSLQIWIDVDEQDPHLDANQELHTNLSSQGIDHQWNVFPGIHFTSYWIEHDPQYLRFYSAAFDRNSKQQGGF